MFKVLAAAYPDQPQHRLDLSVCHNDLGELFRTLANNPEQAEGNYEMSLKLQVELLKSDPNNPEYQRELTRSHNNLGLLLTNVNRHDEAEKLLMTAINGLEKLAESFPEVSEYRSDLARSNINLGILLRKKQRPAESETAYKKSIQLLDVLVSQHADNHDFRYKLAMSRFNLGNLLQETDPKNRLTHAERIHLEANTELKKLKDDYPGIPLYCQELANSYISLGVVQANLGRKEESWKTLENARTSLDDIMDQRSGYAEYQSLYGIALRSHVCTHLGPSYVQFPS